MKISGTKVVIVGAGMVGSAVAFCLTVQGISSEIVIVDVNKEKAIGEVLDLQHSIEYLNRNVRISAGDYSECKDADIVVITASTPMKGVKNRLEMVEKNVPIMDTIVNNVMESGFDGVIIVVTNPVDVFSYYVMKRSGLPKAQVIGTGTALETARLKQIIGQLMRIDPRSIQAYAMGEHGDSMMVPWTHVQAGGKRFMEVMEDNPERFLNIDLDKLALAASTAGFEVLRRKGSTQYGIASAATAIISSVLRDENRMLTVSAYLDGEYGEKDIFCGVPAILGKEGLIEIGEFRLSKHEQTLFHQSADIIRKSIGRLKLK